MSLQSEITQPHITTIETDGRRYNVSVRIAFDGIEFLGRLWFADEAWDDLGIPDRGPLAGRSRDDIVALARKLTHEELRARHRRALSEKRRFIGLRKHTDEILAKIRYLNQVAVSMRAGLLDVAGAAQEIDLTQEQLHKLIDDLGTFAGKED
ncbi:MAG: hypothetical protein KF709_08460 [Gemmatimonadaceae bacterium]|nr:hypothetical protein [Gemmatimonadaceae bacterium]